MSPSPPEVQSFTSRPCRNHWKLLFSQLWCIPAKGYKVKSAEGKGTQGGVQESSTCSASEGCGWRGSSQQGSVTCAWNRGTANLTEPPARSFHCGSVMRLIGHAATPLGVEWIPHQGPHERHCKGLLPVAEDNGCLWVSLTPLLLRPHGACQSATQL